MKKVMMPKMQKAVETIHYQPAISIFLPFDMANNPKSHITYYLDYAMERISKELVNYPTEIAALVMQKLHSIIRNLNFNSNKKSIAIYVSPVFEKVLYLDIPIEQKIVLDESFDIRDLIQNKKELHNYLLLQIGTADSKIFLGNGDDLTLIVSNGQGASHTYENEDKNTGLSGKKSVETSEHNFIRHMDDTIDILLSSYQLPLFVTGCPTAVEYFKSITRHESSIVEYLVSNADTSTQDLKTIIRPQINNWESVKQKTLLNQLNQAAANNRLVAGFKNVWMAAMAHKGHLLIAGRNFINTATDKVSDGMNSAESEPYCKFSCVNNQMDDIIEKVLENGGNVEFVQDDMLKDYNYIALI